MECPQRTMGQIFVDLLGFVSENVLAKIFQKTPLTLASALEVQRLFLKKKIIFSRELKKLVAEDFLSSQPVS